MYLRKSHNKTGPIIPQTDIIPKAEGVPPQTLEAYKSGKFASFSLSPLGKNCSLRRKRNI